MARSLVLIALAALVASAAAATSKESPAPRALRGLANARPVFLDSPINAQTAAGAWSDYYYLLPQSNLPLRVTVSPTSGDPDLFINCGQFNEPSSFPSSSRGARGWMSANAYGDDEITITSDMWSSEGCTSNDDALISVKGFTNASYTLSLHGGSSAVPLYDGISDAGDVVEGGYDLYSFDGQGQRVTFNLETMDGDADLYIGCSGETVDSSNFRWESATAGTSDDSVLVEADDAEYCSGSFSIAVYGYQGTTAVDDDYSASIDLDDPTWDDINLASKAARKHAMRRLQDRYASYIITATTGNAEERLELNFAWADEVATGEYAYFSVSVSDVFNTGVKISIAPQDQDTDVDLVVGCSSDSGLPTTSSNRWTSQESFWSPDTVVVTADDPQMCYYESEIVIGVYGYTAGTGSEFSIVVSPADDDASFIEMGFDLRLGGELTYKASAERVRPEFYLLHLGDMEYVNWMFLAGAGSGATLAVRAVHNDTDLAVLPTIRNSHWRKQINGWDGTGTPVPGEIDIEPDDPIMEGAFGLTAAVIPVDDSEETTYLLYAGSMPTERAARNLEAVELKAAPMPKPPSPAVLEAEQRNAAKRAAMAKEQ